MATESGQNLLFSFVYQLTHAVPNKNFITTVAHTIYILELLLIFFINTNSNIFLISNTFHSPYLPFSLIILIMALGGQIIIALFYKVQFQLFILFPVCLVFLAGEMDSPYFLPSWVSLSGYFLITLLTFFLSYIIFNDFQNDKIVVNTSKYAIFLIITDALFIVIKPPINNIEEQAILILWIVLEFFIAFIKNNQSKGNSKDKLLRLMVLQKYFLLYLMSVQILLGLQSLDNTSKNKIFYVSVPIVIFSMGYSLFSSSKQQINKEMFKGNVSLSQFFSFIYRASTELHTFKTNQNLDILEGYLITFIAIHNKACLVPNCRLLQNSTIQQLKNSNSMVQKKILLHKIIKKIQYLFDIYQQRYNSDANLTLLQLQFYASHLPNKLKIKQIICQTKKYELEFTDKLILYFINKRVQIFQNVQLVSMSRGQDDYQVFKKIMIQNLAHLRQFYHVLMEEKVDLNQLMIISAKLFPLKQQLQQIWKRHLSEIKFVSWNIIKAYAQYNRVILHDPTKACILQDYCKILQQRLKNKHELAYLSLQTQKGLIAVSLSESSLGNIVSLNNQTMKMFSYNTKDQMLALRVNDIMSGVVSQVHDNILKSFLKNRYKQINQDQRLVFGKNKMGFIFPFSLQLNKMSWNTNDELVFISNIEIIKTKQAPMFCITDLEGYIQDKTSTFAWLFCKKKKLQKNIVQNIQQVIPNFFQIIQQQNNNAFNKKYSFMQKYGVKKNNILIEVQFEASVIVVKGQKIGYLVEGHTIKPMQSVSQRNPIRARSNSKSKSFFRNYFNHRQFYYQIPNKQQMDHSENSNELTIPYLRTADLTKMFTMNVTQPKEYGKDIKTLRMINNKLGLVNDQESFKSQFQNEWKEMSVLKRIQNMREELNIQQNNDISNYYNIIIIITTLTLIILILNIILNAINFQYKQDKKISQMNLQWRIKGLLPQYLIYSYFPVSINNPLFAKMSIQQQLIQALVYSSIEQWQKQSIMKTINSAKITGSVNIESTLLTFKSSQQYSNIQAFGFLYSLSCLLLVFTIGLVGMFYYFKRTMSNIYSIFLSINDKKLRKMLLDCERLCDHLSCNIKQNSLLKVIQQTDIDDDQQYQRLKKIKDQCSSKDMTLFCQLIFPILFAFCFAVISSTVVTIQLQNYINNIETWQTEKALLPQLSICMMKTLFKYLNIANITIQNNLSDILQQYQQTILISNFEYNTQLLILKGDICVNQQLFPGLVMNFSSFCLNSTIAFDNNLSNRLSLIQTFLSNTANQNAEAWMKMITILFNLVKPLLTYSTNLLDSLNEINRKNFRYTLMSLSGVLVSLVVTAAGYLICYPIKFISQKILFTKDLVKIIPSQKQVTPLQVLATLTTEAIQFKEYQ